MKTKKMSYRGQASSAQMMSLGGKLTALACHPTKRVNKAEELTYLSINIGLALVATIKKQAPFMNTRNIFMDFKFKSNKID
jgi:hypothetical protein